MWQSWDVMPSPLNSRGQAGYSNSLVLGALLRPIPAPGRATLPSSLVSLTEKWDDNSTHSLEGPYDTYIEHVVRASQRRAQPRAPMLPGEARHSLVSVGSFPELVRSDPPGEVEKPHGILEVEVWNCSVLAKRAKSQNQRTAGLSAPQIHKCKLFLLKLRKPEPHKVKGLA